MKVKKRNGEIVDFIPEKIENSIKKAFESVNKNFNNYANHIKRIVADISSYILLHYDIISIEDIQDLVEQKLMENKFYIIAKKYIIYRENKRKIRENEILIRDEIKMFKEYIELEDWRVNENSNLGYSLQGLNNYIVSEFTKRYWLNEIYTQEITRAHNDGDFHIHDLNLLSVYCCGFDLLDFLKKGVDGVYGKISSKPPKHFRTAILQLTNLFFILQGEIAGAVAVNSLDTLLAPFVYFDNLSYEEVYQVMQEFIFNLNIPTRVGFQTVFSNITFDLKPHPLYKDMEVIIGGKSIQGKYYGDFQKEMDMINRAFCEVMIKGDKYGRPFSFPIPTYNITSDFDFNNPEYELLFEMTRKFGTPYFANFINSDMKPEDARSMCCRLRIDNRELFKKGGGLFGANPKTGSIGVVTINLPAIGYQAKTEEEIYLYLASIMELAKKSLEIKRKVLENKMEKGLYPYLKFYLQDIKNNQKSYLANHFSTIGLIGMNELCYNFLGKGIQTQEGKELAIKILEFMRKKIVEYQEETGNLYNLEATPAESTSYLLALKDKKRFKNIYQSGENEKYYTNSTQLPIDYTDDIFEVLEHQDNLQTLYTGGTVLHIFIGEEIKSTKSIKSLIKTIFSNYHLPYISITPTFSICKTHGIIHGKHEKCPKEC